MKPWLFTLLAAVALVGCPPSPKPPPKPGDDPTPGNGADPNPDGDPQDGPTETGEPKDPLAGSVFDKETLFEIYTGDLAGGDARAAVFKKHRLADAKGTLLPTRVAAYERALKRYASGDPEGWSTFLESLAK
jgi:hypothetical protein